jgi:anti-anti-sigma factor
MQGVCKALGEIDTATAPAFSADIRDAIDRSDEAVVNVDCSAVTFMDSAGYHVLVDVTNYAVRRGHTLMIRDMSPACARLLRLCDLDRELRVEPAPRTAGTGCATVALNRPAWNTEGAGRPSTCSSTNQAKLSHHAGTVPPGEGKRGTDVHRCGHARCDPRDCAYRLRPPPGLEDAMTAREAGPRLPRSWALPLWPGWKEVIASLGVEVCFPQRRLPRMKRAFV